MTLTIYGLAWIGDTSSLTLFLLVCECEMEYHSTKQCTMNLLPSVKGGLQDMFKHYIEYDIKCDLLFGITQCYILLLYISYFTNKC